MVSVLRSLLLTLRTLARSRAACPRRAIVLQREGVRTPKARKTPANTSRLEEDAPNHTTRSAAHGWPTGRVSGSRQITSSLRATRSVHAIFIGARSIPVSAVWNEGTIRSDVRRFTSLRHENRIAITTHCLVAFTPAPEDSLAEQTKGLWINFDEKRVVSWDLASRPGGCDEMPDVTAERRLAVRAGLDGSLPRRRRERRERCRTSSRSPTRCCGRPSPRIG